MRGGPAGGEYAGSVSTAGRPRSPAGVAQVEPPVVVPLRHGVRGQVRPHHPHGRDDQVLDLLQDLLSRVAQQNNRIQGAVRDADRARRNHPLFVEQNQVLGHGHHGVRRWQRRLQVLGDVLEQRGDEQRGGQRGEVLEHDSPPRRGAAVQQVAVGGVNDLAFAQRLGKPHGHLLDREFGHARLMPARWVEACDASGHPDLPGVLLNGSAAGAPPAAGADRHRYPDPVRGEQRVGATLDRRRPSGG